MELEMSKKIFLVFLAVVDVMCDEPTVLPAVPFDPIEDAKKLEEAMDYQILWPLPFGTNEAAIINILGLRSLKQRHRIADEFKKLYSKSLATELYDELSGQFRETIEALMMPRPNFYAKHLGIVTEVAGAGRASYIRFEFDSIIEIFLSVNRKYMGAISKIYQYYFGKELKLFISHFTFSKVAVKIVHSFFTTSRDKSLHVNESLAAQHAEQIIDTKGQWGANESVFHSILMTKSFPHLCKVFEGFKNITGQGIEDAIQKEFSEDKYANNGYTSIVRYACDKATYFATRLFHAMAIAGTDEDTLNRIIIGRSEIDLGDIKKAYKKRYNTNLADDIIDDTSGCYREVLLTLLRTHF